MPSRVIAVLIVGLWLATLSWWLVREVLPGLDPGEPPPFAIDLADQFRTHGLPVDWTINQDDQPVGLARILVRPSANDTYFLDGTITYTAEIGPLLRARIYVKNSYHVTTDGQLLDLRTDITIEVPPMAELPMDHAAKKANVIKGHMEGRVSDQRLPPTGYIDVNGARYALPRQTVELSRHAHVINPLQPVNRIRGLRPGQKWRQATFDPVAAALAASVPAGLATYQQRWLKAEVQPEPQSLPWDSQTVSCLVIHYQGEELEARTWVRADDGLVLRQEVNSGTGGWLSLDRKPE
jgi:hypothetical protein